MMAESRMTKRRHHVLIAFLVLTASFQTWSIWFTLPIPNASVVSSVGMIWMLSLLNGFVIESGALALVALALSGRHLAIDAAEMRRGLSIAAMIGAAAVAASFAFRFRRTLRSDDVSFPIFALSSERNPASFRGGTWVVAAGTLVVFAASVFDAVQQYGQTGSDAIFLRISHIVLAVCVAGIGAIYVVRDVRASRSR